MRAWRHLAPELATAILDTQEPAAFAALSPEDQRVLARLRASIPDWLAGSIDSHRQSCCRVC